MQSFQNYIDRLGLVKAELKCDQEPSTFDVANALINRLERKLGAWRTSKLDDSGIASSIS